MKPIIPLRPSGYASNLSQPEMAALTWFVLSGCTKKEAFIIFARPDMLASKAKAAIDDYVKQFFARKDVKEYLEAYEETINDFIHPKPKPVSTSNESLESKKAKALTKLVEYVLTEANNIDTADDPKSILDFANKIGLFDSDEQTEELPRRYLPVTCSSCEYRKFIEENCERVDDGTELAGENQ